MMYSCRKCRFSFFAPDVAAPIKTAVALLARTQHPMQAIKLWREATAVPLVEAKALVQHITNPRGQCNRCRRELPEGETTECTHCNALNLNW